MPPIFNHAKNDYSSFCFHANFQHATLTNQGAQTVCKLASFF